MIELQKWQIYAIILAFSLISCALIPSLAAVNKGNSTPEESTIVISDEHIKKESPTPATTAKEVKTAKQVSTPAETPSIQDQMEKREREKNEEMIRNGEDTPKATETSADTKEIDNSLDEIDEVAQETPVKIPISKIVKADSTGKVVIEMGGENAGREFIVESVD